jgi:hypothetical protein
MRCVGRHCYEPHNVFLTKTWKLVTDVGSNVFYDHFVALLLLQHRKATVWTDFRSAGGQVCRTLFCRIVLNLGHSQSSSTTIFLNFIRHITVLTDLRHFHKQLQLLMRFGSYLVISFLLPLGSSWDLGHPTSSFHYSPACWKKEIPSIHSQICRRNNFSFLRQKLLMCELLL